jgi:hypothetical protein
MARAGGARALRRQREPRAAQPADGDPHEADVTLADPRASNEELRAMGRRCSSPPTRWTGCSTADGAGAQRAPAAERSIVAAAVGAAARTVCSDDVRVRLDLGPPRCAASAACSSDSRPIDRERRPLQCPGGYVAVSTRTTAAPPLDVVNSGPHVDRGRRLTEPSSAAAAPATAAARAGARIVRSVAEAHGGQLTPSPGARRLAVRVTLPA